MVRKLLYTKIRLNKRSLLIFIGVIIMVMTASKYLNKFISDKKINSENILNIGTLNTPLILNPVDSSIEYYSYLMDMVFSSLVRLDEKGRIEPDIAKHWEISDDGLVYSFYLRNDVRFHDGSRLISEDLLFSFKNYSKGIWSDLFDFVDKWEATGEYVFKVYLKEPMPMFLQKIANKHIVSKNQCATNNKLISYKAIGSGPFCFKEITEKGELVLVANHDYYEGNVFIDRIIVKKYNSKAELWAGFMRGEIDYISILKPADFNIIKQDSSFKSYIVHSDYFFAILYDLNDPIFNDQIVRSALLHAIDRNELIDNVELGYGIKAMGPYVTKDIDVKKNEFCMYDPERALLLFKKAGWELNDKEILQKGEKEFVVNLLVGFHYGNRRLLAMYLRQQLQEVGVKLNVVLYKDKTVELDKRFIENNNINAFLGLFIGGGMDPEISLGIMNEYSYNKSQERIWGNKNKELYNKIKALGVTEENNRENILKYGYINDFIFKKQYANFLYYRDVLYAVSNRLQNTDKYFSLHMPIHTIKDWKVNHRSDK